LWKSGLFEERVLGDGHNFETLRTAILALSHATSWELARKEWHLVGVSEAEEPETCLRGHFPIIEICEIANRVTGKRTEVGNRCIKRFLGFRSDPIFAAIRRIRKDDTKSLNADAIVFFYERKLLTEWEYDFLQDTRAKRNLSLKQMAIRQRINDKVLAAIRKRGIKGPD
jgi:hypothetical protein